MSEKSLDKLLGSISESLDTTSAALDGVLEVLQDGEEHNPDLVNQLLKSINLSSGTNPMEPVSLLSLKNSSMLGYITDLALFLSLRLKTMQESESKKDKEKEKEQEQKVLKSSVIHRVTLERGVKSLEKKLSYQLEKLTGAYQRKEKEQKDIENNVHRKPNEEEEGSGSDNDNEDNDGEEDSEDEGLNYKPNLGALLGKGAEKAIRKPIKGKSQNKQVDQDSEEDSEEEKSNGKYKPPKIAAMALQEDPDKEIKNKKQRNLQSMDEYLQDISDAPMAERSIGSTIVNKGRDMKSKRQLQKEAEVKRYEEENFTRLPAQKLKESKKDRSKRMRNEFFGEDWSMFDNTREFNDNGNNSRKKRKSQNAWDKAKRKIDN